ncbi:TPA: hypothetical protein IXM30_002451 [Enterococcus faecium]|nr:hypothetical protein [Enterococcus faecium]HAQ2959915.1 hypothetical protein [Enterococcus faecium]HAQ3309169.1 hypothetical protein [Enterococcus faecium]
MKYTLEQIEEIKKLTMKMHMVNRDIQHLKEDISHIVDSDKPLYILDFFFRGETTQFEVTSLTLIDYYEIKLANAINEITSLEKRLQKLVK